VASDLVNASKSTGIVWEEIACPLCGAGDEEVLLTARSDLEPIDCRLVRCKACGLAYLNPRPDRHSIGRFYPDDYEPYQAPRPDRDGRGPRWRKHAPSRDSMTAIPFHGEGRLLDFGCGSGWYAHRMRRRGWRVTGMDFNPYAASQVEQQFGIPVLVGSLPHAEVAPESFDVITMGSVLEHVHYPRQVIEAATEALRPEGLLVVVVPNLDSWGFRYFGRHWFPLELPRHLLHFTPASLRRLVVNCGLEVLDLRMLGRTSWMRRSLVRATDRPEKTVGRWLLEWFARRRIIQSLLTRWSVWSKQADCILLIAQRKPAPLHSAGKVSKAGALAAS
jgi:SAM-dependent methyltransferase